MQTNVRVRWDYSRLKLAEFPVFAQGVVNNLTGNPHFANPVPPLQTMQDAIDRLMTSINESANHDTEKIAQRNKDRKIVEAHLRTLAKWTMTVSSSRDVLATTGLMIARPKSPSASLTPVRDVRISFISGRSGCVLLRWRQPVSQRAACFVIEQTGGNPADVATEWSIIGNAKKCRLIITGLVPGKRYAWRVTGLNSLGLGGKSLPVSSIVL